MIIFTILNTFNFNYDAIMNKHTKFKPLIIKRKSITNGTYVLLKSKSYYRFMHGLTYCDEDIIIWCMMLSIKIRYTCVRRWSSTK